MTQPSTDKTVRPYRRLILFALCLMCLAETPGDIGGCGQPAELLSADAFFEQKAELDCTACKRCNIDSRTCDVACAYDPQTNADFPRYCFPLVHDGEVCLRALRHSNCDQQRSYLRDLAPQVPTECNFCPQKTRAPTRSASPERDGGAP